jgi:ketosteroid isomerase-like protein
LRYLNDEQEQEMKTNLEIIQGIYLGNAEQNAMNLKAVLAPRFEWKEAAGFPYTGTFHTYDEVAGSLFAPLATEWIGFRAEVTNFYDAGETIIAAGFYHATYKKTQCAMQAAFTHVWTLQDGKIVKYVQCADTKKVWDAMEGAHAARTD